jgi:atypical dual specificity phosphatase
MGTGGLLLRRLRAKVADVPTGFVWVEKGRIAASGFPASKKQLDWVKSQGVSSVLTLTEYSLPAEWVKDDSTTFHHVPMKDHASPSVESLEDAASAIASEVGGGKTILVHCLAGQGRTMCAIAAYLVKEEGMNANAAIERLRQARPGAVERGQERALLEYEEAVRKPA